MNAVRRGVALHPEWSAAALAGAAWFGVFAGSGRHAHTEAGHVASALGVSAAALAGWLVMAAAMMIPPALPWIRHVALTALWPRRQRTVALFLAGYLSMWLLVGVFALSALNRLRETTGRDSKTIVAGLLVAGAAWQLTPWKVRALRACHLLAPLPPRGRVADRSCVAAGSRQAVLCAAACWPAMLAMSASGAVGATLAAVLTLLVVAESRARRPGKIVHAVAAALLVTGGVVALF